VRICSLLPAATEIVCALGLGDDLTGVTHECDYPPEVLGKPIVVRSRLEASSLRSKEIDKVVGESLRKGESLYRLDLPSLEQAAPDLIISQDLCDVCAITPQDISRAIERLPKRPTLLSLNPTCLGDILEDIRRVGEATGRLAEAERLVTSLQGRVTQVASKASQAEKRPRVLSVEWLDPLMASGHWIPEMVELAGGVDGLGRRGAPSSKIEWEVVLDYQPEVILLMPCGFDVERTRKELGLLAGRKGWARLPAVSEGRVFAMNGHAYYSRPGPRLVDGLGVMACLFHPELFPGSHSQEAASKVDRL